VAGAAGLISPPPIYVPTAGFFQPYPNLQAQILGSTSSCITVNPGDPDVCIDGYQTVNIRITNVGTQSSSAGTFSYGWGTGPRLLAFPGVFPLPALNPGQSFDYSTAQYAVRWPSQLGVNNCSMFVVYANAWEVRSR
jgi:hypothetical protein